MSCRSRPRTASSAAATVAGAVPERAKPLITLTGEHGVGVLKRQWVAEELGPTAHAVQQRIKKALDPRGILNPGKAL